jgi:hypothetical protein
MPKKYVINRGNLHDVRKQIGDVADDLSDRIGGGDTPVQPYLPAIRKGTADLEWVPGTYYDGDMVRDGGWLMVANKKTTDKPAPQPAGPPAWTIPDAPAWTPLQYTGVVYTGFEVTVPGDGLYTVQSIRAWIPNVSADATYRVIIYEPTQDRWEFGQVFQGDALASPGWLTVSAPSNAFTSGEAPVFVLESYNSAADTVFNHPWLYAGTAQTGDPGAGNWNRDNQQTVIRVDYVDDDAVDQSADLGTVIPGSTIRCEEEGTPANFWLYTVNTVTDQGGYYEYGVSLQITGGGGVPVLARTNIIFTVPIPVPADYVELTNHYAANPDLQGYIAFDSITGGTNNGNAYGLDVQWQAYTASDDWDVAAVSASSSSGASSGTFGDGLFASTWSNDSQLFSLIFWSRFLPVEQENLAKAMNHLPWPGGMGIPTWQEVWDIGQFVRYASQYVVSLHDPYIILGVNQLELISIIGPGRAAIILTP